MTNISDALTELNAVAANVQKAEEIWSKMTAMWPDGPHFGADQDYRNCILDFDEVIAALPMIDGWRPNPEHVLPDEIAQAHLDASDIMEHDILIRAFQCAGQPGDELAQYKHLYKRARARIVHSRIVEIAQEITSLLTNESVLACVDEGQNVENELWTKLRDSAAEIEALLGRTPSEIPRWGDFKRHLHFAAANDLSDVVKMDWPAVHDPLLLIARPSAEPIPVGVDDLSELYGSKSEGPISIKIAWENLAPDDFERLIFDSISRAQGYENAAWLTATNAPDRGRDLSVDRVIHDPLGGTRRERVIIQCKHYLKSSISVSDVAIIKEQVKAWEPPAIDVLVFATSGRFTADAVQHVEAHNADRPGIHIEMWPDSHLERILAAQPDLVAEYKLRG